MTSRSMALGAFLLLSCGCSGSSASGEGADAAADRAVEDHSAPDVALDSTDDGPGAGDAMGSEDAGAFDAQAEAEAGPYACSPRDVSGFEPSWHPPSVQSACTSTDLDTYIADCWGPNSSESACSSFKQSDPSCFNCMTTFDTAAAWGALVESSGQQLVYGDFSDCLAIETGDQSSTSCAAITQAAEECSWAACSGPTCPPATTAAEASLVGACEQTTYDGGCAAQWSAEQACVNGLYASGGIGTAAVQKCSFNTYGSYDIYFRALGGIFCAAPSDAGAEAGGPPPEDASADSSVPDASASDAQVADAPSDVGAGDANGGGGASIVGCYAWNAGGVNSVAANMTMTKYCSAQSQQVCDSGTWVQTGPNTYRFNWNSSYVDTMTFSNGTLYPVGGSNAGMVAPPTVCP